MAADNDIIVAGDCMRKMAIFFFSGTGNTWWVSGELVRLLREKSIWARACSIEQLAADEVACLITECETVGFGYPIYGSDLPGPMKKFMQRLPTVKDRKCFVFCTQWLWSGDGARTGADFLKPKGFDVRQGEHFLMPNNVCVEVIPLPFTNERSRLDAILDRTSHRIERFVGRIAADRPSRRGFNPVSRLLGAVQRVPFQMLHGRLQDDMRVDPERCTLCGYCEKVCPSGNLVSDGGSFTTRNRCVLCMRCYNFCPESAITYRHRPHNLKRGVPYRGPAEKFDPRILR